MHGYEEVKAKLTGQGPWVQKSKIQGVRRNRKIKEKSLDLLTGPLTKLGQAQLPVKLLQTPSRPKPNQSGLHCSLFTIYKPNPNWAPEESKAQLKWAPATSKDGSDYDPPSPVTYS